MSRAGFIDYVEKAHYPFKAYPHVQCVTVLFAGCSLPSLFPRTMDALAQRCRSAGYGIVYDCCGDSLAGFGRQAAADRVLRVLDARLRRIGCERVVAACPNCLKRLGGNLGREVVGVSAVVDELGLSDGASFGDGALFVPCPDKRARVAERAFRRCADMSGVRALDGAGCCGLRPDIAACGSKAVGRASRRVLEAAGDEPLYSYCASCLGQFARSGHRDCRHVLSVLLGVDEQPDTRHALANRARRRVSRESELVSMGDCND